MPPRACKVTVSPIYTVVSEGEIAATGRLSTVTEVLALAVHPFPSVAVIEYVPPFPLAKSVGLCVADEKELGPLQLYEDNPFTPPVKEIIP